ncbi:MAG: hypothetical protein LQ344_006399 [Seirophora lacunosa]|nr:MAG: hypothetical protein LQ344_006399 [Seirophora lacunosa]
MENRRTTSADFRLPPTSPSASNANYSPASTSILTKPPAESVMNMVDSQRFDHTSKSASSPARLQHAAHDDKRTPLPTASPPQRSVAHSSTHNIPKHRRTTPELVAAHQTHSVSSSLEPRGDRSDPMQRASLDPPVTKESLSELDLNRIIGDARLRHDINFEHEIMFRPNTYGTRGARKKREEDRYFEALAIEFEFYIRRQICPPSFPSRRPSGLSTTTPQTKLQTGAPRRVRRMIGCLRDVVKTLVPAAKWQAIDDQFDVDLRMQELEHGICDIGGLLEWLGKLLLCSCSPMRDTLINTMITKSLEAIRAQDARKLVGAIKDLFSVLETMKLDVANHQIRYLRLYLLEDSIPYEQSQVLDRMAAGWSISHERRWFEAGYDHPENEDSFLMFKERMIDMVVSRTRSFPTTFTGDYDRLIALQHDFQLCHYHAACVAAFRATHQQLGARVPLPYDLQVECMQNIWAVIAGLGHNFSFGLHGSVYLQIATEACRMAGLSVVPDNRTLSAARWFFQQALDEAGAVKTRVWDELARVVHLEAETIFDMTPLEMLNRYDPGPPVPGDECRSKELSLDALAKRTAHVVVVHWKVWAPILYNRPARGSETAKPSTLVSPYDEMAERRRVSGSSSSVKASKPVVTPGHGENHHSKTASISSGSGSSHASGYTTASDNLSK